MKRLFSPATRHYADLTSLPCQILAAEVFQHFKERFFLSDWCFVSRESLTVIILIIILYFFYSNLKWAGICLLSASHFISSVPYYHKYFLILSPHFCLSNFNPFFVVVFLRPFWISALCDCCMLFWSIWLGDMRWCGVLWCDMTQRV